MLDQHSEELSIEQNDSNSDNQEGLNTNNIN